MNQLFGSAFCLVCRSHVVSLASASGRSGLDGSTSVTCVYRLSPALHHPSEESGQRPDFSTCFESRGRPLSDAVDATRCDGSSSLLSLGVFPCDR